MRLAIPQVRECAEPFYPQALERGQRSEKALSLAVAEMYLQGVSTRRVTKVLESLCGTGVSSTTVSRVAAQLDPMLEQWRQRPIEPMAYVILDARYEKVRVEGAVRSCAVLIAIGVRHSDGKRMVLGVSVSLSEAEVHWRDFLCGLRRRGLGLPELVTSDAHEGLRAALRAVFRRALAALSVPPAAKRSDVCSQSRSESGRRRGHPAHLWQREPRPGPGAADASGGKVSRRRAETGRMDGGKSSGRLRHLCAARSGPPPAAHFQRLRKPQSPAAPAHGRSRLFPNEASLLRLATALLMEISEDWETSKAYLALHTNPHPLKS